MAGTAATARAAAAAVATARAAAVAKLRGAGVAADEAAAAVAHLWRAARAAPSLTDRLARLEDGVARHARDGEPVQYIVGSWDFGRLRDLAVRPPTLIPRPETELLVALAAARLHGTRGPAPLRVLDVGCGSAREQACAAHQSAAPLCIVLSPVPLGEANARCRSEALAQQRVIEIIALALPPAKLPRRDTAHAHRPTTPTTRPFSA